MRLPLLISNNDFSGGNINNEGNGDEDDDYNNMKIRNDEDIFWEQRNIFYDFFDGPLIYWPCHVAGDSLVLCPRW